MIFGIILAAIPYQNFFSGVARINSEPEMKALTGKTLQKRATASVFYQLLKSATILCFCNRLTMNALLVLTQLH